MIIEIPIITGSPPDTGTSPYLQINADRFNFVYDTNNALIFYGILPNTYLGNSLNVNIYWLYVGYTLGIPSAVTWGVSFQRIEAGDIVTNYLFSSQQSVTDESMISQGQIITTVNLPVDLLQSLRANDLFRIKLKLISRESYFPLLTNLMIDNGD